MAKVWVLIAPDVNQAEVIGAYFNESDAKAALEEEVALFRAGKNTLPYPAAPHPYDYHRFDVQQVELQ